MQTNSSTIDQIVHSYAIDQRVAQACKTPVKQFASGISTQQLPGSQPPNRLAASTTTTVLAHTAKVDECAADALAHTVITRLAPYASSKIAAFNARLAADERSITETERALARRSASTVNRLVLLVQLRTLQSDRATARQLLFQAMHVELPRLVAVAHASTVTARTRRTSTLVAALLGAILGIVAVISWDRRRRRTVMPAQASSPPATAAMP